MQTPYGPEAHNLNPDPLLSMKESAAYLGVSLSAMYALAEREKFPIVLVTSDRKIRRSVLDDYIKKCEQPWRWMNVDTIMKVIAK
jgi:excisionase family DNA binding protein